MEFTPSSSNPFIVADDLGLDSAVNEGIFFALKNGLIDGVSLMAIGEMFDNAIRGLKNVPNTSVGIHLVLVEERSLTRIKLPQNHRIFFIKYVFGLIKKDEIEKELEAQVQKILGTGVRPRFINSHQHLHLLPGIMDIIISLAKKYGVKFAINSDSHSMEGLWLMDLGVSWARRGWIEKKNVVNTLSLFQLKKNLK